MTSGETLFLIGVIAAFVIFSAMLAYSSMTSHGPDAPKDGGRSSESAD